MKSKYTARGYRSDDIDDGCDDEQGVNTLKVAERIAKYWLTPEYLKDPTVHRKSTLNVKYLTEEELQRLFSVITSPRDRAIFRLAYHRGLRASEVGKIQMSDWRPAVERLAIPRLKNGNSGEYVLTTTEAKALRSWIKERGAIDGPIFITRLGSPISQQMLDVLMKKYCKLASVNADKAHFHALRHSCATSLMERGEDIAYVKDHLGHKNITSTDIYAKITNRLRDSIAKRLKGWK